MAMRPQGRRQGKGARGQIEFGESLMVVIVLVFILVVGIVFYYKISAHSIKQEVRYREDIGSVVLAKRVLALPELRCEESRGGGACIDVLKLQSLGMLLDNRSDDFDRPSAAYYGQLFEYALITVDVLGTDGSRNQQFVLYNDTPPGNLSAQQQFIFTTVYDPVAQAHRLAYLNVTRYVREAGG